MPEEAVKGGADRFYFLLKSVGENRTLGLHTPPPPPAARQAGKYHVSPLDLNVPESEMH